MEMICKYIKISFVILGVLCFNPAKGQIDKYNLPNEINKDGIGLFFLSVGMLTENYYDIVVDKDIIMNSKVIRRIQSLYPECFDAISSNIENLYFKNSSSKDTLRMDIYYNNELVYYYKIAISNVVKENNIWRCSFFDKDNFLIDDKILRKSFITEYLKLIDEFKTNTTRKVLMQDNLSLPFLLLVKYDNTFGLNEFLQKCDSYSIYDDYEFYKSLDCFCREFCKKIMWLK